MPTRRAFARPGLLQAGVLTLGTAYLAGRPDGYPRCGAVIRHPRPPAASEAFKAWLVEPLAEPLPCPRFNIPLADGRKVNLADLRPGTARAPRTRLRSTGSYYGRTERSHRRSLLTRLLAVQPR
jgi:hypothetical protein